MAKVKRELGIKPYFTALVYETRNETPDRSRDVYQADMPSIYAEARLGVASRVEIEGELVKLVNSINDGSYKGDIPFFKKWLQEREGRIEVSDLEDIIAKDKKSAALINQRAVNQAGQSSQGTLTARVKSRTSAVSTDTLRLWDVEMSNYSILGDNSLNPSFRRDCNCGFKGKHTNKRKLGNVEYRNGKKLWDAEGERNLVYELISKGFLTYKELGRELHVCCYHEAALITEIELQNNRGRNKDIRGLERPTTIAFDFIDRWDLVFEEFARRYKYKQLYGEIDEYLFTQDVITPYFKEMIKQGKVTKEVIKKSKNIEPMAKKIVAELHKMLLSKKFAHKGFAWDFIDVKNKRKEYKTIGIAYESTTGDTSYHIIYDNTFWMPYLIKKEFVHFDDARKPTRYQINPINLLFNKGKGRKLDHIYEIDDRTQRLAKVSIIEPDKAITFIYGAKKAYERYRKFFDKTKSS